MTQAVLYAELDLDFCSRAFGVAPCTAVKGTQEEIDAETATGLDKCYNTLATCQDRANFDNSPVTLRFCKDTSFRDFTIDAIPNIKDFSLTPAKISLGQDLGQRASLKISFVDTQWADDGPGFDPYVADRDYSDTYNRGTFWGKFHARQPYLRGRTLRLIQGTADQALADMEVRTFEIESFEGPGRDGVFTIVAKDILKRADGDRAVLPAQSTGQLSANITSGATSATLAPSGIGNTEYPESGYISIGGKEIVSFTRSGDTLTLTRAQYNTEAVAHDAGDRLQVCLRYSAQDPADILADMAENGAMIDSGNIPLADWQAETTQYYGRVLSALIPEPTPVRTLMSEVMDQCGMAMWWDDLTPQLRLQVLRQVSTDAELYDDSNIIAGSLRVTPQPGKRITRARIYFGQRNPLDGVTDPKNFRSVEELIDTNAEANNGISAVTIFSRWIPFGGNIIAQRVNAIKVARYKNVPRKFTHSLPRYSNVTPTLGAGVQIEYASSQDAGGALLRRPAQIIRVNPKQDIYEVEAEELNYADLGELDPNDRPITIDSDINDVNVEVLHQEIYGAPLAGSVVTVTVNAGVVVGSTSTSTPALDIGDTGYWPTQAATGNTTSSSAVITGLNIDAETLLAVGQVVTGTGIAAGSRIASIDSASQITLDTNATASGTGVALTVYTVQILLDIKGKVRGPGGRGGEGGVGDENAGTNGLPGGTALYTRYPTILDMAGDIKGGGGGGGGGSAHYEYPFGPQYNGPSGGGGAGRIVGPAGGSIEGSGSPGTLDAGGSGGTNNYGWTGGAGAPPGSSGSSSFGGTQRYGGAAGAAVDGWSNVIEDTVTGSYAGGQVN